MSHMKTLFLFGAVVTLAASLTVIFQNCANVDLGKPSKASIPGATINKGSCGFPNLIDSWKVSWYPYSESNGPKHFKTQVHMENPGDKTIQVEVSFNKTTFSPPLEFGNTCMEFEPGANFDTLDFMQDVFNRTDVNGLIIFSYRTDATAPIVNASNYDFSLRSSSSQLDFVYQAPGRPANQFTRGLTNSATVESYFVIVRTEINKEGDPETADYEISFLLEDGSPALDLEGNPVNNPILASLSQWQTKVFKLNEASFVDNFPGISSTNVRVKVKSINLINPSVALKAYAIGGYNIDLANGRLFAPVQQATDFEQ